MKKFKRLATLACAGTMLVSQVIPAFAEDSTINGNVGVENDNSSLSGVYDVVLPASETTAYDFTIDPDGLLSKYSSATSALDKVLFKTNTPESFKADTTFAATRKFVVKGYKEDTSLTELKKLLMTSGAEKKPDEVDALLSQDANNYAVWVPVATEEGIAAAKGEFKRIEDYETLQKYITVDVDTATGKIKGLTTKGTAYDSVTDSTDNSNLIGENVFDGYLYKEGYVDIADADLGEYVNVDSEGTMELVADSQERELLDVKADGTDEKPADVANIKYTPASTSYDSECDDIVITNKSLGSVAVSVDINVNTDSGLKFTKDNTFAAKEDIYLGLQVKKLDGTFAEKAAVEQKSDKEGNVLSCKTSATFAVAGVADAGSIKYQGKDDDRDEATNSHNYHTYVTHDSSPSSVTLNLKAAINETDTDWNEYVKELRGGTKTRPTPSFVFAFNEELGQMKKDSNIQYSNDKVKYTVDGENMVTATTLYFTAEDVGLTEDGSNYKFTLPVEVPMITVATTSITSSATDKAGNAVSVKLTSTADSNEISFPASALKGKEKVKITITDTATSDKYETTNATYVISVN